VLDTLLSFFWILEYQDGSTICQFDRLSGRETLFSKAKDPQKTVRRAVWMPFSVPFAQVVRRQCGYHVCCLPTEMMMVCEVPPDGELILRKRHRIPMREGTERRCLYLLGYSRGDEAHITGRDNRGLMLTPQEAARMIPSVEKMSTKALLEETD